MFNIDESGILLIYKFSEHFTYINYFNPMHSLRDIKCMNNTGVFCKTGSLWIISKFAGLKKNACGPNLVGAS